MRLKRATIWQVVALALLGALAAQFGRDTAPALAANYLFLNDIPVTLSGFPTTFTVLSGSKADSLTIGATTLAVTVASGETFTIRYPGPNPGRFTNLNGVDSCVLVGINNDVTVSGPMTATLTPVGPDASPCPGSNTSTPVSSIAIGSPNGGEALNPGANALILWSSSGGSTAFTIRILLSTDGGMTFPTTIIEGIDGFSGAYSWTVPALPTTSAKIKVEATSGSSVSDASDGNFAIGTSAIVDTVPPAAVTSLVASNPTATAATLAWTAPGDDGTTGTAVSYDVRYSTSPISDANFGSAIQVIGEPTPASGGTLQTMTVLGLTSDVTYYFAMKASDEASNVSMLSNVPSLKTASASTSSFEIISPNDGEQFLPGQYVAIVWGADVPGAVGVRLSYALNGGVYAAIADGLDPAVGVYYWPAPDVTADTTVVVKAEAIGSGGAVLASDASDPPFSIIPSETPVPPETEGGSAVFGFQPTSSEPGAGSLAAETIESIIVSPPSRSHDYDPTAERAAAMTIDIDKGLVATSETACQPGTVFRGTLTTVYYCGKDGKRYPFPNEKTYFTWFKDFSPVKRLADAIISSITVGEYVTYRPGIRMLKLFTDPKTYAVSKGGILRHMPDETTAADLYGGGWRAIIDDIAEEFFFGYILGKPIL